MSYFNEKFYTNDFDQEMLDFVEKKYGLSKNQIDVDADFLRYGNSNDYFWTCNGHYIGYMKLTKQEFKQKIGMEENMTTKQFTKADLVAGKHVFKTRSGLYNLVIQAQSGLGGVNLSGKEYFGSLTSYAGDLLHLNYNDLDIVEIYELSYPDVFGCLKEKLKSIWKREEKTEAQIQLEKLQQQITELQAQANKLKATL